ncbi:hypothetical protein GX51_03047 [Blastomyces parvus]|uniref:Uncharacterized protein n=1 Tax=Blastomyces parvus TaxID=2060905 RepID=A0A2B7X8D2_9EURO|nr:hypothetical protein GX51_03047 [Blastomyces parvus]
MKFTLLATLAFITAFVGAQTMRELTSFKIPNGEDCQSDGSMGICKSGYCEVCLFHKPCLSSFGRVFGNANSSMKLSATPQAENRKVRGAGRLEMEAVDVSLSNVPDTYAVVFGFY